MVDNNIFLRIIINIAFYLARIFCFQKPSYFALKIPCVYFFLPHICLLILIFLDFHNNPFFQVRPIIFIHLDIYLKKNIGHNSVMRISKMIFQKMFLPKIKDDNFSFSSLLKHFPNSGTFTQINLTLLSFSILKVSPSIISTALYSILSIYLSL